MKKINVINNVKNLNVTINESEDGFAILIAEKEEKTLGKATPGSIVTIGKRKYIVLGHAAETTAIYALDNWGDKAFDNNSGDYKTSDARKYLNKDVYKELCDAVGKENIIKHKVNLEADDGSNKGDYCEDFVSLITTANYRRYREYIPNAGFPFWTATRVTTIDKDYSRDVCYVFSRGFVYWGGCGWCGGVRPFCILNSSVSIS